MVARNIGRAGLLALGRIESEFHIFTFFFTARRVARSASRVGKILDRTSDHVGPNFIVGTAPDRILSSGPHRTNFYRRTEFYRRTASDR